MDKNIKLMRRGNGSLFIDNNGQLTDVEGVQDTSGAWSVKAGDKFVPWEQVKANLMKGGGGDIEMGWGDVLSQAGSNIVPSAKQFGKDIATPFMEPVKTGKALGNLALGLVQKLIPGEQPEEATVDAVGKFLAERYGGLENIKRTIAKDPVGILADVSMIVTGGGMAAARAPGFIGQAGRVGSKIGQAMDPISGPIIGTKFLGSKVAPPVIGFAAGTGSAPIRAAFQAGVEKSQAFLDSLKGDAPITNVVDDAKAAVAELHANKTAAYNKGMAGIKGDPTVLEFSKIEKAVDKVRQAGKFEGQVISKPSADAISKIDDIVNDWKIASQDNPKLVSAAGIDALKKKIFADVIDGLDYGTQARGSAMSVYHNVKKVIEDKFPAYAKVMKDFEEAASHLDEIQKTLSLNPGKKINVDTQLRKLTSIMRNNVNTNYGRRTQLAESLGETKAGSELIPKLAGQTLNKLVPRGLQMGGAGTLPAIAAYSGQLWPLLGLPFQSPKLMGYGAYGAGRASAGMRNIANMMPPQLRNIPLQGVTAPARVSGILANESQLRAAPRRNR